MENASLEKRILAEDRGDQKMVRAGWLARLCMAFFLGSVLFTWMIGCSGSSDTGQAGSDSSNQQEGKYKKPPKQDPG